MINVIWNIYWVGAILCFANGLIGMIFTGGEVRGS